MITIIGGQLAWVALDEEAEGGVVAFVIAERRYPTAAEITFATVRRLRRAASPQLLPGSQPR